MDQDFRIDQHREPVDGFPLVDGSRIKRAFLGSGDLILVAPLQHEQLGAVGVLAMPQGKRIVAVGVHPVAHLQEMVRNKQPGANARDRRGGFFSSFTKKTSTRSAYSDFTNAAGQTVLSPEWICRQSAIFTLKKPENIG